MCKTYILNIINHCWDKLKKTYINGEIYFVHESEDSMLKCQFSNYSTDYKQVQYKPNQKSHKAFFFSNFFGEMDKFILKFIWHVKAFGIVMPPWGKNTKFV